MTVLELFNVSRFFGDRYNKQEVLNGIQLKVSEGEFLAIIGYSGSGKSTLMNLMCGLLEPSTGTVLVDDREADGPGDKVAMVFQNYALLPWLTVEGNVMLAVEEKFPEWSHEQKLKHAHDYIAKVNLSHALHKKPSELSGGMRQRVSVARALSMKPKILLMDEPLSALDAITREEIQKEFAKICAEEKITVIMVTNDLEEAILLADRIVTLLPGPGATLGREFLVPLARPRTKTSLNASEDYKVLRREIRHYMNSLVSNEKTGIFRLNEKLSQILPAAV